MKKYRVLYGDWTGESVIAENLTQFRAKEIYNELTGDNYQSPRIVEYEIVDIREDRKLKLDKINESNVY